MSVTSSQKRLELTMIDTLDIMAEIWTGQSYAATRQQFEIISIEPEIHLADGSSTPENHLPHSNIRRA